ncbi:MAG: prepilin-type N-terminal cleavage/methylation domain-containing protein [Candidatus Ozemobacteraceae bacterium]
MRARGFTLINLMITAAVISVLSAIAIPKYLEYVTQARKNSCYTNMRLIMLATEMYNKDHSSNKKLFNDELETSLIAGGYLKFRVTKPETGCRYSGIGPHKIRCAVHGSVEE